MLTRILFKLARTNKYSALKLATIFNCGRNTILGTLNRHGTHLINLGRFKHKYTCDSSFFNTLTPISAYWAGFIAADGALSYRDRSLNIGLSESDTEHLQKFLKAIKSDSKIFYTKSNNSAHAYICSTELFNSLVRIGIIPNKSLRLKDIKIPHYLASHFIRGVFDGDGSISGKKVTHIQFQIAGYRPFLEQIQNVLIKACKVKNVNIYPLNDSKASRLQYTGYQIFRILDFIYKNSTKQTRLERKYKKYLELKRKFKKI